MNLPWFTSGFFVNGVLQRGLGSTIKWHETFDIQAFILVQFKYFRPVN